MDIHTPSMPKIPGSISTGAIMKMTVRQKDKIADVFPSFNAGVAHVELDEFLAQLRMFSAVEYHEVVERNLGQRLVAGGAGRNGHDVHNVQQFGLVVLDVDQHAAGAYAHSGRRILQRSRAHWPGDLF